MVQDLALSQELYIDASIRSHLVKAREKSSRKKAYRPHLQSVVHQFSAELRPFTSSEPSKIQGSAVRIFIDIDMADEMYGRNLFRTRSMPVVRDSTSLRFSFRLAGSTEYLLLNSSPALRLLPRLLYRTKIAMDSL